MLKFEPISLEHKEIYKDYYKKSCPRGCEMSFGNLFLWGEQKVAIDGDFMFFLSTFSKSFYPFPLGAGDKKQAIEKIMADAKERGIPLVITSLCEQDKTFLEQNFPDTFEFSYNDGSFDYVYDINDLADLLGKKYHKKRTHLNNFKKVHQNYRIEPFNNENLGSIRQLVEGWYSQKEGEQSSIEYEKKVFQKALANFSALDMEGLVVLDEGEVIAVTFASPIDENTFDVHFEKAKREVDGAYVVINNEFAKYIRNKYPSVKYLNREEDMGIEGLRKSKQSYYPHHQVEKYQARLK